jgi:hypothetical protein
MKNRVRWTFGGLSPRAFAEAEGGSEKWQMRTDCLVEGAHPSVSLRVRFLHLIDRQLGRRVERAGGAEDGASLFTPVDVLRLAGWSIHSWQEAAEREVSVADIDVREIDNRPRLVSFRFESAESAELVRGANGDVCGRVTRTLLPVEGVLEVSSSRLEQAWRLSVRIRNITPLSSDGGIGRDDALLRSFVSTHVLLTAAHGAFVSCQDPPAHLEDAARHCLTEGAWPILVGPARERNMMILSPIILNDYPEIAAESPGDLFDAAEIDEILTLRILTMTDEEKAEAIANDSRARVLVERTEALEANQLMALHGVMRRTRNQRWDES